MNAERDQSSFWVSPRESLNWLKFLADAHAACLVPFFRTRFGTEGIGVSGLAAFVLILAYAGFARAPEMLTYFWAWLFAVVVQRCRTWRLVLSGWQEHSRYTGWPWLAMQLPFVRGELVAKGVGEPALCLVVGTLLCSISDALGQFVMVGFLSIGIGTAIDIQADRMRLRRMRDAAIEQRQLAQWYREGNSF